MVPSQTAQTTPLPPQFGVSRYQVSQPHVGARVEGTNVSMRGQIIRWNHVCVGGMVHTRPGVMMLNVMTGRGPRDVNLGTFHGQITLSNGDRQVYTAGRMTAVFFGANRPDQHFGC